MSSWILVGFVTTEPQREPHKIIFTNLLRIFLSESDSVFFFFFFPQCLALRNMTANEVWFSGLILAKALAVLPAVLLYHQYKHQHNEKDNECISYY